MESALIYPDPALLDAPVVVKRLRTDQLRGLTTQEAARRLLAVGTNDIERLPPVPAWRKLVAQFRSPLIYLLFAALVASLAVWVVGGDAGGVAASVAALGLDASDGEHGGSADVDHVAAGGQGQQRVLVDAQLAGADEHHAMVQSLRGEGPIDPGDEPKGRATWSLKTSLASTTDRGIRFRVRCRPGSARTGCSRLARRLFGRCRHGRVGMPGVAVRRRHGNAACLMIG